MTGLYNQAVTKLNSTTYLRPALQNNNSLRKKHNTATSVPRLPIAVAQCPSRLVPPTQNNLVS